MGKYMIYEFAKDSDIELDNKLGQAYKRLYACSTMNNQVIVESMNTYIESIKREIAARQSKKKKVEEQPFCVSHEYIPPQNKNNKKKPLPAERQEDVVQPSKVEVRQKYNFKFTTKPVLEKEDY